MAFGRIRIDHAAGGGAKIAPTLIASVRIEGSSCRGKNYGAIAAGDPDLSRAEADIRELFTASLERKRKVTRRRG